MVAYFDRCGAMVVGVDNNLRSSFFGPDGDTRWNRDRLLRECRAFVHRDVDVRDRDGLTRLVRSEGPFDLVIHCAAQPSHDLAARRPYDDFDVNAVGTLNLLEAVRLHCPEAVFVLLSTNKVYGDAPNELPLVELERRWDYALIQDKDGVNESMRLDASTHSLFGVSKLAADVMTQEYGRTFGMRTTSLRCGCLTGPNHSAVELHGFLSYLVKTQLERRTYRVFGYKGKQVRDNIHSHDVATAVAAVYANPRPGEVYNLGGGREGSCSILEAFELVEAVCGVPMRWEYVDEPRHGDHVCYITDLAKFRRHHPEWSITRPLDRVLREIVEAWRARSGVPVQ
jgi:CDP-paratose 2-epimerase